MIYRFLKPVFTCCFPALVLLGMLPFFSFAESGTVSDEPMIQAMFGISLLDEEETTLGGSTDHVSTGMSTFPILSVMGQSPLFTGTNLMAGLEGGGELSWLNDKATVVNSNGTTLVYVKNKMVMGNLLLGGFIGSDPDENVRFYAGAGTSLNWGRMSVDSNYTEDNDIIYASESESSFGYGFYLRCGMEFMLSDGGLIGLCAKASTASIDYESSFSREDYNGIQIMMSYTAPVTKMIPEF